MHRAIRGVVLLLLAVTCLGFAGHGTVSAQDATPSAMLGLPDPSACTASPRTREDIVAVLTDGTPVEEWQYVEHESELPKGSPVDDETAAEITETSYRYLACANAADWPRVFGMLSDRALRSLLTVESLDFFLPGPGTPIADSSAETQTALVAVRDIRLLDDGRVGAVVEWGEPGSATADEANFHVFIKEGDTWLLDDEISGFTPWYQAGESAPNWSTEATPVAS